MEPKGFPQPALPAAAGARMNGVAQVTVQWPHPAAFGVRNPSAPVTPPGLWMPPAKACEKLSRPLHSGGLHPIFGPRSGKLKIRRMTAVSVLARCDKSSNEHSETIVFLTVTMLPEFF